MLLEKMRSLFSQSPDAKIIDLTCDVVLARVVVL